MKDIVNTRIAALLVIAWAWAASGCSGNDSGNSAAQADRPYNCTGSSNECLNELAGDYQGTYSGDTNGTWVVTISPDGTLSGMARNSETGVELALTGSANDNGSMVFGIASDGTAFSSQVSATFTVSGHWALGEESGVLEGRRISAAAGSDGTNPETGDEPSGTGE